MLGRENQTVAVRCGRSRSRAIEKWRINWKFLLFGDDVTNLPALEHPVVYRVFEDSSAVSGVRRLEEFSADDIQSEKGFQDARAWTFRDLTDTVDVWPRRGASVSTGANSNVRRRNHFAATAVVRSPFRVEFDATHKKICQHWLTLLNRCKRIVVLKRDQLGRGSELATLVDYTWEEEVHRIVSSSRYIRHDLFGMKLEHRMSTMKPWVAIEVINHHHPEEAALRAMLQWSARVPLIVLFVHVDSEWAALVETRLPVAQQSISAMQIEARFYIENGKLHCLGTEVPCADRNDYDTAWSRLKTL